MSLSKLKVSSIFLKRISKKYRIRKISNRCKKYTKVTHCIFDLDGTILDNQSNLDDAFKIVFEKYGKVYTPDWRLKLMGMTGRAMWENVATELNLHVDWNVLYQDYKKAIEDNENEAPLRPGIEKLINHLYEHEIPIAIATSSRTASTKVKTSHIKHLMSKFSHVLCGGDSPHVKESKPSGQIYLVCAALFSGKPDPPSCLVFEDSPIGVLAAMNACMQVVGIPCPPTPPIALRHADEVLNTLEEFWPGKYGIPPYPEQKDVVY